MIINEFNITLKSIKGKDNNIADRLSRCYIIETEEWIIIKIMIKDYIYEGIINGIKEIERDENGKIKIRIKKTEEFIRMMHQYGIYIEISFLYQNLCKFYNIKNIREMIRNIIECYIRYASSGRIRQKDINAR